MKTIDELGISPAPWFVQEYSYYTNGEAVEGALKFVEDGEEGDLFSDDLTSIENARLIAAAPDCYEALRELLTISRNRMPSQPTLVEIEVLRMAESALAKAAGEEVTND